MTGFHRREDETGTRAYVRGLLRVPRNVAPWLWYLGLGLGVFVALVALGGLTGLSLGLINNWFR